ncbi:aspartyl-phosphate phosphatase Spo0E family protein [Lutibacter sp. B2]|nr:aspartyl-phosphate phosphatase Spo0E family protein [Lutibacter sp. B2]
MDKLYELKIVKKQISELRNKMHDLINKKNNLIDYEILDISQALDRLLNRYYKIKSSIG